MRRTAARNESGALSLSYVIIMPVVLTAIMIMMQASAWYLARDAALAAARQGADVARVRGSAPSAGPQAAVAFAQSAASGWLLVPSASAAGSTATTIEITVTGRAPSLVPGMKVNVSETVQVPAERFYALSVTTVGRGRPR